MNNFATVCGFNFFFDFLICAMFSPSDCRLTASFMGKWYILYERSITKLCDQAIKFYMHRLEMCTQGLYVNEKNILLSESSDEKQPK